MSQVKSSDRNRWSLIAFVLMIGFISLVQPGCNCGSSSGTAVPAPVASVFPTQGSDNALTGTIVAAYFGIDMNENSIDDSSFTLTEVGGAQQAATVSYDPLSRTAILDPVTDLVSGTEYRATVSSTVEDAAGNMPLASDYVWSFTVSQATELVSKDINGVVGNDISAKSAIDGTGRYVVFESEATNLVTVATTFNRNHIYRKDTLTGEVLLASSDTAGLEANNNSSSPRVSDDGRYVVFESTSTNLDIIASGGFSQIYIKDMTDGSIVMISRNSTQTAGNGNSNNPDISADGKFVVFDSNATNLGGSGFRHVYLVDTSDPDTVELISVNSSEVSGNGNSSDPSVSDDGQRITFVSSANNLDTDSNNLNDVFLRDRNSSGTTVLISMNSTSTNSANDSSNNPDISGDGQYVVFESPATDIDGGVAGRIDIFLSDTVNPATRVTVTTGGNANDDSENPSISYDGRYIAFESQATNLDGGVVNKFNIFVSDESAIDDIRRVSLTSDDNSNNARISPDGRYVSFDSPYGFTLDDTNNGLVDTYRVINSTF